MNESTWQDDWEEVSWDKDKLMKTVAREVLCLPEAEIENGLELDWSFAGSVIDTMEQKGYIHEHSYSEELKVHCWIFK